MEKLCQSCKKVKYHNVRSTGKPQYVCRDCHREWCKRDYRNRTGEYKERSSRHRQKYKSQYNEFIRWLKDNQSCIDCSGVFRFWQLDFDHLRDKEYNVSQMVYHPRIESLQREILKCELVCKNCHANRTWLRSQEG